jgi:hypothetical protein
MTSRIMNSTMLMGNPPYNANFDNGIVAVNPSALQVHLTPSGCPMFLY